MTRRVVGALAFLLALGVLPLGCAFTTPMVHPAGAPVVRTCHTWGYGWLGLPLTMALHQACIADQERQGFIAGETKMRLEGPP